MWVRWRPKGNAPVVYLLAEGPRGTYNQVGGTLLGGLKCLPISGGRYVHMKYLMSIHTYCT